MTHLDENFRQECCPKCGVSWDDGSIIDTFIKQRDSGSHFWKDKSDDDIRKCVVGWTNQEIFEFAEQNFSLDEKKMTEKFLVQDRKKISHFMFKNFNVDIDGYYSPPYRWSRVVGIEIQGVYDGISYWQCPDCNTVWNRHTGEEEVR
jgi:Zn-finger nucleic acid-binding protein